VSPRRSLAVVVLAALPLAAACAAGKGNETERERTSPYVANASIGTMLVRAALVITATATPSASPTPSTTPSPSPSPSPSGSASPTPSPSPSAVAQAYLVVTFVNHGRSPDTLDNVTAGNGSVQSSGASSGPLTILPGRTLSFGDPELGAGGLALSISGLASPPLAGTAMPVSFTFRDAGTLNLQVPVRDPGTVGTTATATPIPYTGTYPALPTEVPESASPLPSESSTP
jgi:hypothetical protein